MTRRGLRDRLTDIRVAALDAIEFSAGLDAKAFAALPERDRRTFRALKNVLTEIGEAVKMLPPELLARHAHVDWRGWAGLRDIVAHQYFSLEIERLRPTLVGELPALLRVIEQELAQLE